MRIIKIKSAFEDSRGKITDILVDEPVEHVNLITFKKNAVRGNHYHKQSLHYNYVLRGTIKLYTKKATGDVETTIMTDGDLALIFPSERHALVALEDSELLVFTRGTRGGENYEQDTYRLDTDESLTKE